MDKGALPILNANTCHDPLSVLLINGGDRGITWEGIRWQALKGMRLMLIYSPIQYDEDAQDKDVQQFEQFLSSSGSVININTEKRKMWNWKK